MTKLGTGDEDVLFEEKYGSNVKAVMIAGLVLMVVTIAVVIFLFWKYDLFGYI